jgi:raffinose/stachyose/melibiose transport system permease protein
MLNFKNNKAVIIMFLLPIFLIYLGLVIFPAFQVLFFSFFKWRGLSAAQFNFYGLNNYREILTDRVFWISVKNLLWFLFLGLVVTLPISFVFAYLLSQKLRGTRIFKLLFFIPVVLSAVGVSLMWKLILAGNNGLLNEALRAIGLGQLARQWLTDPSISFTSIVLVDSWIRIGFFMVILLAGIVGIPEEIFESLKLDGASEFRVMFGFVIPLIWDVIGVCVVLLITRIMRTFDLIYVLTSGTFGPVDVNQVPIGFMYYRSFIQGLFGNGSAIAVIVLLSGSLLSSVVYHRGFRSK